MQNPQKCQKNSVFSYSLMLVHTRSLVDSQRTTNSYSPSKVAQKWRNIPFDQLLGAINTQKLVKIHNNPFLMPGIHMLTVVFTYLLVVCVVNQGRVAGLPLNHVKDESSSLLVCQVVMSLVLLWLHFKVIIFQLFILQHVFKTVVDVFTNDTETIFLNFNFS